ncbi:MAG: glycoside hydrolase family 9 protein, partial [Frankiaceae bacterium]|nr:glycoside hydrolase family 9 protein [Frankiaceae bacterium]
RTLYLQVGIGSGDNHSYYGDHDLWRLPEADDHDRKAKDRFAAAHRPVFRAAAPGHRISPNLAGRVSAAFALAAQNDAATPTRARHELATAMAIYGLAKTRHPPRPLITANPVGYYPEDSWRDDMALGATEIAVAKAALGDNGAHYTHAAGHWVMAYLAHEASTETFNLYDTSALAEFDLAQLSAAHPVNHPSISRSALLRGLERPLARAAKRAGRDPFGAGGYYDEFDVDSHTFGLIAVAQMYDVASGSSVYRTFATEQRDWLFGANAWGASFMVGEGRNFPRCMQHQIANLAGSRNGATPLDVGAVVNGPNDRSLFRGGLGSLQDGVRRCPADRSDPYAAFTGHGSRYLDDVRSWQTSEPAIDMTGTALLAAALQF